MRSILRLLLSIAMTFVSAAGVCAEKTMECERYTVVDNRKQDRTIFRFTLAVDKSVVRYKRLSGPDWFLPSDSSLQAIWVSNDALRVVAYWRAKDYGVNKERWSPVYVLDIDFGAPDFRDATYGGFADLDETVSSPWKQECRRLD
jgi:hypothetical protein